MGDIGYVEYDHNGKLFRGKISRGEVHLNNLSNGVTLLRVPEVSRRSSKVGPDYDNSYTEYSNDTSRAPSRASHLQPSTITESSSVWDDQWNGAGNDNLHLDDQRITTHKSLMTNSQNVKKGNSAKNHSQRTGVWHVNIVSNGEIWPKLYPKSAFKIILCSHPDHKMSKFS